MGQLRELLETIDETAARAKRDGCTHDTLAHDLAALAEQFETATQPALAFIADTASQSCKREVVELASTRFAIADLCERLVASLESDSLFDFTDIDASLTELLFPSSPAPDIELPRECDRVAESKAPETAGTENQSDGYESFKCSDLDLLREFLQDAKEHLEQSELLLLTLETEPENTEAINGLFRAVHSVKGSSGVLNLNTLGDVSHFAESVLVRVRDGELRLRNSLFDLVLLSVDFLKRQIKSIQECCDAKQPLSSPLPPEKLIPCLENAFRNGAVDESDVAEIRQALSFNVCDESSSKKSVSASESIRVDGKRLDQLINLIGELVITESSVRQELERQNNLTTSSLASRLNKVIREVQELSLSLKMVPIGNALQKMNRVVRDLATKLNKPCRLLIEGGDTEVDKTLLEGIADPLVHLIRNALDHGIEQTTKDRVQAGKPETGMILVSAEHCGGSILIRIEDDGRGLNRDRILQRAIEKNIVDRDTKLSPHEIDQLIFKPGFSTAEFVSDVSGRGVGMDVVLQNIETMRGSITVQSEPGSGTKICLELPLTLSIIDGTVIRVGGRSYILPTLSVVEQVQTSGQEFARSEACTMLRFRERFIQSHRLGDLIGTQHDDRIANGPVCVIVESSQQQHGLIVDEVVGQQAIVIKPLGGVLDAFDIFAGGALLAGGEIAFVLDLHSLCKNNTSSDPRGNCYEI